MTKRNVNVILCRLVLVVDRALGARPSNPPQYQIEAQARLQMSLNPLYLIALTNKMVSEVLFTLCEPLALSSPLSRLILSFDSYRHWKRLSIRNLKVHRSSERGRSPSHQPFSPPSNSPRKNERREGEGRVEEHTKGKVSPMWEMKIPGAEHSKESLLSHSSNILRPPLHPHSSATSSFKPSSVAFSPN